MRLSPKSLQGRMLLLSAVAIVGALIVAGWTITSVLERFVIEGLDRRLDAELSLLASSVDADGNVDRNRLLPHLPAFENGPGWRWRIAGPAGTIGSAEFPILHDAPFPPRGRRAGEAFGRVGTPIRPLEGQELDGARVHARRLTFHTSRGDVALIAAAPREVVSHPIRAALAPLLTALAALAALLAAATIVQLRLGLRPLRRMRAQVAALRTGKLAAIDEEQPSELRPLAAELNALARDNAAALDVARQSAANLAHALKTPIATLALDLRHEPERAAQIARIETTIRHHLGRARAAATNRRASTSLAPAVEGLVAAIRRLHADRDIAFHVAVEAGVSVAMDANDLDELIGNLVDNAARYAKSAVSITARGDQRAVAIDVADDGPGIPAEVRAQLPHAGTRLDEDGGGHGFGLSIAAELAALYGGALALGESASGGLLVSVSVPGCS